MKDLNTQISLARQYHRAAFTNDYVFTFTYNYKFYAVKVTDLSLETLVAITRIDRASSKRGGFASLRFKPTNAIKAAIIEMGAATVICSKAAFEEMVKSNKYNKGENAEKLVTEVLFGQTWEKDNVPFTDGGDVNAEGRAWQHKHEGATFCNEKSLYNLTK